MKTKIKLLNYCLLVFIYLASNLFLSISLNLKSLISDEFFHIILCTNLVIVLRAYKLKYRVLLFDHFKQIPMK